MLIYKYRVFSIHKPFILEVNQVTLNQFKTTKFYKTMKEFYMTKPFKGKTMNEIEANEVLKDFYWISFNNDNLDGIK